MNYEEAVIKSDNKGTRISESDHNYIISKDNMAIAKSGV